MKRDDIWRHERFLKKQEKSLEKRLIKESEKEKYSNCEEAEAALQKGAEHDK